MLAALAVTFTSMVDSSTVIPADQKQQIATTLDEDDPLMSNTELEQLLVNEPPDVQAEIIRINTGARPFALQVALLVPLIAGILGATTSFRMGKIPEVEPAASLAGMSFG